MSIEQGFLERLAGIEPEVTVRIIWPKKEDRMDAGTLADQLAIYLEDRDDIATAACEDAGPDIGSSEKTVRGTTQDGRDFEVVVFFRTAPAAAEGASPAPSA